MKSTNEPTAPFQLERIRAVCKRTGLSRSSVWVYVKNKQFPAPTRIGARAVAWPSYEVDAWIRDKINARS